jgi:hypothetical protein
VRITGAQVRNLLRYCYTELLKIFERLGVPVLDSLEGISDRPKSGRHEGLGTFNTHLWGGQDPPRSRLSAAQTSRECSIAEVFLALVTAISGGGHLRITDIGRSKLLGADRSFIWNHGVVAFGYAAGFKAQGQCSERRLTEQLVALKQLVCSLC